MEKEILAAVEKVLENSVDSNGHQKLSDTVIEYRTRETLHYTSVIHTEISCPPDTFNLL